jgi:hypothetical protein
VGAAQADLEHALLVVLAARTGDPKCPDAAELGRRFDQLDGRGVDAWVQSATKHIEKCTICNATVKNRRPLRLFEELPHSFMPPGVRSRVLESLRDPAGAAFATRIAERAGRFDENGFPLGGKHGGGGSGRKWVLPAGFAGAAAAVGVLLYVMLGTHAPATTPTANTGGTSSSASATATDSSSPVDLMVVGTPSASGSASASPSASTPAAQMTTPRSGTGSKSPTPVRTTPRSSPSSHPSSPASSQAASPSASATPSPPASP